MFGGFGRALSSPHYRLYACGHIANVFGWWGNRLGIGWLTWELTGSAGWLGIVAFAGMIPVTLVSPFAGVLADRTRLQGRLLLGTFWWVALGYLLASTAPSFWSLAILLAIGGMGDAAWHPIATGILVRQMPKQRGQALGVHAVGGTLAEVLSPLLVGFLLAFLDWRVVLQISVMPAALMGIAFLFIARRIPSRHVSSVISRADLGAFIAQWRSRTGLLLIAGIATYNMALIALMTMSPLFMQRELGFSSSQTGMAFAAAMLAGSIGQPIVGRLSDRRGRFGIFAVGSVVAAGLAGTVVLLDAPVLIISLLTMAMAALVAIRSGVLAMAVDHASKHEATALGFVFVVLDGVGALGAVLAGLVGDFSLVASFGLAGGLSLLAVGFIATVRR